MTPWVPNILLVDDLPANLERLEGLLSPLEVRVFCVQSGREALSLLNHHSFALVICDLLMPEMDGLELARRIYAHKATGALPILFVSKAQLAPDTIAEVYRLGAVDFLEGPIDQHILLGKVAVFLKLERQRFELDQSLGELSALNQQLQAQIEARKLVEQAYEQTQESLQTIINSLLDAILILTPDGRLVDLNQQATQLFGQSKEDLLSGYVDELFQTPGLKEPLIKWIQRAPKGELIELQVMGKSAKPLDLELSSKQIQYNGEPRLLLTLHDISHRKASQDRLRKLSQAVEQSPASILITDLAGHIEYINPRFTELTGYSAQDILGKNPRILRSGQTPPEVYRELWRHLKAGQPWTGELINRRKNGETYVELTHLSPIFNEANQVTHYLGIKQDITDRKQAEEALIEATIEANQANQAKSEFLANMSHEIRTPMNAILGFSEILQELVEDPQQSEFLGNIRSSGEALLTLINDILDLSKVEAGKLKLEYRPTDLKGLLEEMGPIFAKKLGEKDLLFHLEIDPQLPPALALDESRIRQILLNLIGNAVKFTHQGRIHLKAIQEARRGQSLDLLLVVEDTGIGIAPESQQIVFGAFEQVPGQGSQVGGTGLGLAITKRLVEMMGGQIDLSSQLGQGSCFNVHLRGVEITEAPPSVVEETAEASFTLEGFAPARLLVVDDIEINRKLLIKYLKAAPFEVYEACNGAEAVDQATTMLPDLILMDMKMPVLDGFEATARLKSQPATAKIPVIAVTAAVMKDERVRILALCDDMLSKPLSKGALVKKLGLYLKSVIPKNGALPAAKTLQGNWPQPQADDLAWLLEQTSTKWQAQWAELNDSLTLNLIEDWAAKLRSEASRVGYTPLYQWAEEVYNLARAFEADQLAQKMTGYPDLIEPLAKACANATS
ncbi:MAG: response regulator [bacterium]|nr:response regulator [bacterium]